jgi:hypothetical protein
VVFTWHLPDARKLCAWNHQAGFRVHAGGPAVDLMPVYLVDVTSETGGRMHPLPLSRHNPGATFTSRGCVNRCPFCAVPIIEGEFRELDDWIPAPIVCDNNLLASSRKHFDTVIDRLKAFDGVDFNQGLDARLLNSHHIERLQELHLPVLRFSWDHIEEETVIMDTLRRVLAAGFPKRRVHCYILFGFNDTPEDALYRAETVKALGIKPFMMRYQPLNALKKDQYDTNCMGNWKEKEMARFQRYWCRQNWLSKIPYAEFVG